MMDWIKEKWKYLVVGAVTLLGVISVYVRGKNSKKVLKKANESHQKENKINQEAIDDLKGGFSRLQEETLSKLTDAKALHDLKKDALRVEKKEFIKNVQESEDLAESIADHIGAEIVKSDD